MSGFEVIGSGRVPIKAWTRGVPVEDQALAQLKNVASLPFIHSHVAVMPDVHWGRGATVGSVIATVGAIVPAAVGVDIGCGMMAVRTSIRAEHLPDNLSAIRSAIEAAVPHGRTDNGGRNDVGAWQVEPPEAAKAKWAGLEAGYKDVVARNPKASHPRGLGHLGTLGTGNHFIEVCLDEADRVWVMLHSGSRGVGNKFGSYFIERAKRDMERWFIHLPDKDLAYFPEGSEGFIDYIRAVSWAQKYAFANREVMMERVLDVLRAQWPDLTADEMAVNCHHNFALVWPSVGLASPENPTDDEIRQAIPGTWIAPPGSPDYLPRPWFAQVDRADGSLTLYTFADESCTRVLERLEGRWWVKDGILYDKADNGLTSTDRVLRFENGWRRMFQHSLDDGATYWNDRTESCPEPDRTI